MRSDHGVCVATGRPYRVTGVGGHEPRGLEDFTGVAAFTVDLDAQDIEIAGEGTSTGDRVRFHQKDADHAGRDVRVWTITVSSVDGYAATSESAF